MKYYIYISDSKVDMLLQQIPHTQRNKVTREFGFDWKLFSAKRKTETEADTDRVARLETVIEFIRRYGAIGSIDHPEEYIESVMPMRRAPIREVDGLMLFGGGTARSAICLIGSSRNMIGASGTGLTSPFSDLSAFTSYAMAIQNETLPNETPYDLIHAIATSLAGPEQRLEFLAKRLAWNRDAVKFEDGEERAIQIAIASPLYVALAD